jgi:hypothetical protein
MHINQLIVFCCCISQLNEVEIFFTKIIFACDKTEKQKMFLKFMLEMSKSRQL